MQNDQGQPGNTHKLDPEKIYPSVSKGPNAPTQAPAQTSYPHLAPSHGTVLLWRYVGGLLGSLVILAIVLPPSHFAQTLAYPVIILGAVAGFKFFADCVKSSKAQNAAVKTFVIIGGLGMGAVIFTACVIAGIVIGFSKDPHPQPSA